MINSNFEQAASEVLDILNHTEIGAVNKIPKKFIEYLKENSKKGYVPNLDHTKTIEEMNLMQETKELLGTIYRNWWASPEEKKVLYEKIRINEIKKQKELEEKYSYENLFKNKKIEKNIEVEETAIIEYKESLLTKFIKLIKKVFLKEDKHGRR